MKGRTLIKCIISMLQSLRKSKNKQVSRSRNKKSEQLSVFQKVWKITLSIIFFYDQDDLVHAFSSFQSWQKEQNKIYTYEVFHQYEHSCALQGFVLLQNLYNKYHICISFDHQEYVLIEYVGSYSNLFQ